MPQFRGIAVASLAALLSLTSCSAPEVRDAEGRPLWVIDTESPRKRKGMGPPPYRYWRIVGEPMPEEAYGLEPATAAVSSMAWSFVGGRPVRNEYWSGNTDAGGRVVSIACHPTNAAVAYAASASGGIWKTTDFGANWVPLTDGQQSLNHGAVAIDRNYPDSVYAGTGEYTTGSVGVGILRSTDGGASWSLLSSQVGPRCSGLFVSPGNSATAPSAIHYTGSNGYLRSINGGVTWSNPITGRCSSLAVDPNNPLRVFVGVHGVGIRRSTDGGGSFTSLAGGLPTSGFKRIVLAIAQSNPQVLYAAFVSSSTNGLIGFYRTANGGDTWTQLTATPDFPRPQGWYDLSVGVDPSNPNHVFCGGVSPIYATAGVIETVDGGASWTEISSSGGQIHPDQQWVTFGADGTPWFGCDGGVWRRVAEQWINCNATLAAIQNYTINQHPDDPNRMMGGTQDNGTAGTTVGALGWPQVQTGDGGFGAYDRSTLNRFYTTYIYLKIYRHNNGTLTNISGPWTKDPREWVAPIAIDPNDPQRLYAGSNRLWVNTAASSSETWTAISTTGVADGGTISAIEPVAGLPGVVWVANNKGGIWRTLDGGATWAQMRAVDNVYITVIDARPGSNSVALAARDTGSGTRLVRTTNGTTWSNASGSLPSGVSAKALAVDWGRGIPATYIGSGAGVYASWDSGATWEKDGADLPNVNIGQLEIDAQRRTIIVGTYGRGAWRSPMPLASDLDLDGSVSGLDLSIMLSEWGPCGDGDWNCRSDLSRDGAVTGADLGILLGQWGI
jgi:hypothetical protein